MLSESESVMNSSRKICSRSSIFWWITSQSIALISSVKSSSASSRWSDSFRITAYRLQMKMLCKLQGSWGTGTCQKEKHAGSPWMKPIVSPTSSAAKYCVPYQLKMRQKGAPIKEELTCKIKVTKWIMMQRGNKWRKFKLKRLYRPQKK